jgi:hypothetical protein
MNSPCAVAMKGNQTMLLSRQGNADNDHGERVWYTILIPRFNVFVLIWLDVHLRLLVLECSYRWCPFCEYVVHELLFIELIPVSSRFLIRPGACFWFHGNGGTSECVWGLQCVHICVWTGPWLSFVLSCITNISCTVDWIWEVLHNDGDQRGQGCHPSTM